MKGDALEFCTWHVSEILINSCNISQVRQSKGNSSRSFLSCRDIIELPAGSNYWYLIINPPPPREWIPIEITSMHPHQKAESKLSEIKNFEADSLAASGASRGSLEMKHSSSSDCKINQLKITGWRKTMIDSTWLQSPLLVSSHHHHHHHQPHLHRPNMHVAIKPEKQSFILQGIISTTTTLHLQL